MHKRFETNNNKSTDSTAGKMTSKLPIQLSKSFRYSPAYGIGTPQKLNTYNRLANDCTVKDKYYILFQN